MTKTVDNLVRLQLNTVEQLFSSFASFLYFVLSTSG